MWEWPSAPRDRAADRMMSAPRLYESYRAVRRARSAATRIVARFRRGRERTQRGCRPRAWDYSQSATDKVPFGNGNAGT